MTNFDIFLQSKIFDEIQLRLKTAASLFPSSCMTFLTMLVSYNDLD
jgi:hypothetical protein